MRSKIVSTISLLLLLNFAVPAQQTNPVDKQVANPMTDTPNVNPVSPQDDIRAPKKQQQPGYKPEGGDGEVVVYSDKQSAEGEQGKRVVVHSGNVDVRYGIYRLQADKITIYEETNRMVAEGNVIFDQGDDQRITGSKGEWNYRTKLGYFVDSTGFTNQTNDGTVIYFTADRVERVGLNEIVVINGKFTACEDTVPQWSFTADRATIKPDDRIKLKNAKFRLRDIPIIPLPYASLPIKKRDRQSGFLTPTFGFSQKKGVRFSSAYFQTPFAWIFSARAASATVSICARAPIRARISTSVFTPSKTAFSVPAKTPIIRTRAAVSSTPTAFIIFKTDLRRSPMCV